MQNNPDDNNKISELEEKIENLNSDLNEKEFIMKQTKEYLFVLQSENEKNALKLNKIKKESSDELNKINKLNKDYENRIKVLENKNNHLKKQYDEILSSNSWKITKPIRSFRHYLSCIFRKKE